MPTCSHRECDADATVQWPRAALPEEIADETTRLAAIRAMLAEGERDRAQALVDELEVMLANVPTSAEFDGHRSRVGQRIVTAKAALDAGNDSPPAPPVDVVVAVFGCDTHALDAESAALTHKPTCTAPSSPCACHGQ